MLSTSVIMKWNIIDSIIFSIENLISKIAREIKDVREDMPDPEEMIAAATKELQDENEELKQYRIPGSLIEQDGIYMCPVCRKEISDIDGLNNKIKYCNNCGKRIILSKISPYGIAYVNNLVEANNNG
ncbi:MAG: hypothetical protein HDR19_02050 [Lachnospiraceae bacterium]|nr:hypothetical protein [Lachnospiraceae bacterium]